MNRGDYITSLFNDIKDNIEFDSDIIALNTLLKSLLKIDLEKSFLKFKELIEKNEIKDLIYDVDFTPLFNEYLEELIYEVGFISFFNMINTISQDKRVLIFSYLFNIYVKECFLYRYVNDLIINEKLLEEKNFINIIIKESVFFPIGIFDKTTFLKNIILIHIKNNKIPVSFLKEITELPNSLKEKAILKTLLLDYI